MKEKNKHKKTEEEKPLDVTPGSTPLGDQLADWLEALFPVDADGKVLEHPQKIQVVQLFGRDKMTLGEIIDHEDFRLNRDGKVTEKRPSKEFFQHIAAKFIAAAQRDCDMLKRAQDYGVRAFSTLKDVQAYKRFPLALEPQRQYRLSTKNGHANGEGEEEDENTDRFGSDKLLRRMDRVFKDMERFLEQTFAATGDMFRLYGETNMNLRAENLDLRQQWTSSMKAREEAESHAEDRALARRKQEFWLKQWDEGAYLAKGLLPPAVNKILGKDVLPTDLKTENMVFKNFLDSCRDDQIERAFGKWDSTDPPQLLKPGIFTPRQAYIIDGIAKAKIDVKHVQILLQGDDRITAEQLAEAQQVFSETQLIPIKNLFMQIMTAQS